VARSETKHGMALERYSSRDRQLPQQSPLQNLARSHWVLDGIQKIQKKNYYFGI
jgi:hypothetical protein